ncbi:MAG TPA: efflux RND transporter periplasmic adaptor subunit [Phnomibacter sp.]|nr:efflux RND transporter periplasmic adaptor subunit [Phnomibacter sp.]
MKTIANQLLLIALATSLLIACGQNKKEAPGSLGEKKAELAKLQQEAAALAEKIGKLETEIAKLDTSAKTEKGKLIAIDTIALQDFSHFIELQGKVDADNISYVTPRGGPGQVQAIYVVKGQMVKKGQPILKLDDRIIRQQKEQLLTQLNFAKDILKRREDLWKQNIGSEVELLSARNNVTQIERQLSTLNEQMEMTNVTAEVSGVVDDVMVKVGEIFQGGPQIRIVNTSSLKVVTDVPENYLSKVGKGSKVEVNVPDINKSFNSSISFVSASINPASRGFSTEAKLPSDAALKPNQIALVRILDYAAPNVVVVPINVIQTDEKGKFVFVATKENGEMTARKKPVTIGMVQGDRVEIKSGLSQGETLITEGFQGLYDGQKVSTSL